MYKLQAPIGNRRARRLPTAAQDAILDNILPHKHIAVLGWVWYD